MGEDARLGPLARLRAWLPALAPIGAVLAAPDTPFHATWTLVACAAGALFAGGALPWTAVGVLASVPALARGPFGAPLVAGAVLVCARAAALAILRRRTGAGHAPGGHALGPRPSDAAAPDDAAGRVQAGTPSVSAAPEAVAALVLCVAGVIYVKQRIAASVLPAATEPLPELVVGAVLSAGILLALWPRVSTRVGARRAALGLLLAALGPSMRLALARMEPAARDTLAVARRLDAVDEVYVPLLRGGDRDVLRALVVAAPDRDAAALSLGWRAALDLGWRPARASTDLIAVAEELERRGRGGEALRLLARAPREGDVDWLRALYEVTQGEPVRWRGGRGVGRGGSVPGRITEAPAAPSAHTLTFTALTGADVRVHAPAVGGVVEARLDAGPAVRWDADITGGQALGAVAPGPHRLVLRVEGGRFAGDVAVEGAVR